MNRFLYYILFILLTIYTPPIFSQSSGLKFDNHNVEVDKRSGLKLLEIEKVDVQHQMHLSADILFNKSPNHYFGYLLRIIDDSHRNIDIVYNYGSNTFKDFSVIYDHNITPIQFDFSTENPLNKWVNFDLKIDVYKKQLLISIDGKEYKHKVDFMKDFKSLKFYFGANNNPYFKVHDVPPFSIRDIKLKADDLQLTWPLDEESDQVAHCLENEKYNGKVINPVWLKEFHSTWHPELKKEVYGSLYYYDDKANTLYYVNNQMLFAVEMSTLTESKVGNMPLPLKSDLRLRLLKINDHQFICYNLRDNLFYDYNVNNQSIKKIESDFPNNNSTTHHTVLHNDGDSLVYFFGGYGNHAYSNDFVKYNVNNSVFEEIKIEGDSISPRYFTAVGQIAKDKFMLFGGYGSRSGVQIINPENYYDLYQFDVKTKELKNVQEWPVSQKTTVPSRTILFENDHQHFYALTYDNHRFNNELELVQFDIQSGTSKTTGNKIPFVFNDVKTVVDLKYDQNFQKYYALIIDKTGNNSTLELYGLDAFGGLSFHKDEIVNEATTHGMNYYYLVLVATVLGVGIFFIKRKKKAHLIKEEVVDKEDDIPLVKKEITKEEPVQEEIVSPEVNIKKVEKEEVKMLSTINFFGGFRITDIEGNDISNEFTPLIKQLFILISLSQFSNGRGVTVEKMTNLFWYDMPKNKARNNRSVNITKLRHLCKKIGDVQLVKNGDFWQFEYSDKVNFPIFELKNLLDAEISKDNLLQITQIIQNGKLLLGTNYEWLEEILSSIVNDIIETLYEYLITDQLDLSHQEKVKVSDLILKYDPLNEEAIQIKCKLLLSHGMHSTAKDIFEKFTQEYELLYDEPFEKSYADFLKNVEDKFI
ncbi:hypothetical protein MY04_5476 [Flammeovirga sp. MY04]|uniref:Kelch repeat-containing protein n=1 Tax=Flammeovirga sp. MY04 TaxID=1191459 RepID=UPI000825EA10|nr:kelch repeat-containing protein [Flammeovirga sp. MY04]ANQ52807.2 hypothetical protein MY04_5476 [Flammeovirga sp. MY04]